MKRIVGFSLALLSFLTISSSFAEEIVATPSEDTQDLSQLPVQPAVLNSDEDPAQLIYVGRGGGNLSVGMARLQMAIQEGKVQLVGGWHPCRPDEFSPTPRPGFKPTQNGYYRRPNVIPHMQDKVYYCTRLVRVHR